ncbi:hypothetical protein HY251_18140 [bacterium]|nr:hypothetical protein [bacterium]
MQLTKEKAVFGIAAAVTLVLCFRIHKPQVEPVPPVPPEEAAHQPRIPLGAPIPSMRPEKPLLPETMKRDPFVRTTDWSPATPASLSAPPAPSASRIIPHGGIGGGKPLYVTVDQEPKADLQEPDPNAKDPNAPDDPPKDPKAPK